MKILDTQRRARELRRDQTPAEIALWELLRDRQLLGLKFRRQIPVSRYIADFCCPDLRLIVELDGEVHSTDAQIAHDQNRDEYLQALGYEVLRFPNERLLTQPKSVIDEIIKVALTLRPSLAHKQRFFSPSPGEGDGEAGEGVGG